MPADAPAANSSSPAVSFVVGSYDHGGNPAPTANGEAAATSSAIQAEEKKLRENNIAFVKSAGGKGKKKAMVGAGVVIGNYDARAHRTSPPAAAASSGTSQSSAARSRSNGDVDEEESKHEETTITADTQRAPSDVINAQIFDELSSEFFVPRGAMAIRSPRPVLDKDGSASRSGQESGEASGPARPPTNRPSASSTTNPDEGNSRSTTPPRLNRTLTPPPNTNNVTSLESVSPNAALQTREVDSLPEQMIDDDAMTLNTTGSGRGIPRHIMASTATIEVDYGDDHSENSIGPRTIGSTTTGEAATITQAWGVEEDQKKFEALKKHAVELQNERDNAPRAEIVMVEPRKSQINKGAVAISRWRCRFLSLLSLVLLLLAIAVTAILLVANREDEPDYPPSPAPSSELFMDNTTDVPVQAPTIPPTLPPTLTAIKERGYIKCRGVPEEVETGVGFSVDMVGFIILSFLWLLLTCSATSIAPPFVSLSFSVRL